LKKELHWKDKYHELYASFFSEQHENANVETGVEDAKVVKIK
jgi:hypothetical protein